MLKSTTSRVFFHSRPKITSATRAFTSGLVTAIFVFNEQLINPFEIASVDEDYLMKRDLISPGVNNSYIYIWI